MKETNQPTSIEIKRDFDLTPLTTFGLKVKARYFAEFSGLNQLIALTRTPEFIDNEIFCMGGGSNLFFQDNYAGFVIHSTIKGIKRYDKDSENVFAIVGSGEKWSDFVDWTLSQGLAGVENLAGIPGEVGAAPIQNIGAYGMEASDSIHNVECFDLRDNKTVVFQNSECKFGYRDSIFKNEAKGRYVVLRVSFKLKNSDKATVLNYGALKELSKQLPEPTIKDVADEILKIRNSKLPSPELLGNVGSFFKNPIVLRHYYEEYLKFADPNMPFYETDKPDFVKLPAGWLIEHAGLKGLKIGDAMVYPEQCLVIVNKGDATASDVGELVKTIINRVRERFGVVLEPEATVVDSSMRVTVLGSGTSKGVPEIGCACKVCRSTDEKDKRLRCSVLVEKADVKILIDVSPDFREQALRLDLYGLDAALITHSHYDHVGGIDDLRPFCINGSFPLFMKQDVSQDLHRRLDYCFKYPLYPGVPSFDIHEIDKEPFFIKGIKIVPISIYHGKLPILGYRIGDFAFITDAKTIPDEEFEKLEGLKVLIINALRDRSHIAHFSVDEALEAIERIKPEKAYLIHFNHEIGLHADIKKRLPENVYPCYDGMTITVNK